MKHFSIGVLLGLFSIILGRTYKNAGHRSGADVSNTETNIMATKQKSPVVISKIHYCGCLLYELCKKDNYLYLVQMAMAGS